MLLGGKWGNGWHCPICYSANSGARLKCLNCEYKTLEDLDTCKECGVKREWVDLTDDEICAVMDFGYATDSELENAHAVIAAFKEKNK